MKVDSTEVLSRLKLQDKTIFAALKKPDNTGVSLDRVHKHYENNISKTEGY